MLFRNINPYIVIGLDWKKVDLILLWEQDWKQNEMKKGD
jgi:hypothetical protein